MINDNKISQICREKNSPILYDPKLTLQTVIYKIGFFEINRRPASFLRSQIFRRTDAGGAATSETILYINKSFANCALLANLSESIYTKLTL